MIKLDENSYILALWFNEDPTTGNDWMCCMQRRLDTNEWRGDYRFRYKKDDKIFGSDDEKSWYAISLKGNVSLQTDDEMEKFIDGLQQQIRMMYPVADKLIVKGGLEDLIEKSKTKPWMHMKVEAGSLIKKDAVV